MHKAKRGRVNQNIPWVSVIRHLAPEFKQAISHRPTHVPCPMHGGQDGLRCFDDFDETGGMICNTCGAFPNGYLVLAWALDLPTKQVARIVRKVLRNGGVQNVENH